MDYTQQSPLTTISIGPGIRGIERGIERVVRLDHIAYVEIEAFIIENLVAEMEAGILAPAVIWSDGKTFPAHYFRGKVNLLLAGYPCQPFSNAGKRGGAEDPRHLYPYIERTVDIIRPDICFFENVRGHVTLGLREVIESLEGLGYRVHWGIFSAEETGASHKRERVFIMAVRKDIVENSDCESDRDNERRIYRETTPASSNLVDSTCVHAQGCQLRQREEQSGRGGNELDNTSGYGLRQDNEVQARGNSAEFASKELGYSNDTGLQGRVNAISGEHTRERITGPNGPFCPVSRPGQPQQAWEHPRVISRKVESDVGMSVNGYHFREDFLRAIGNSVYPDAAELAFSTLLKKHGL